MLIQKSVKTFDESDRTRVYTTLISGIHGRLCPGGYKHLAGIKTLDKSGLE